MYHDVAGRETNLSGGREYFSVPVRSFEGQLDQLADLGFSGCSIESALEGSGRRIAVSFDDGDMGQFVHAFPALARRGMTATFFVTTSWIGRPGYVSWDGLREMKAAGMSVQSHTRSHPYLSELEPPQLRDELCGSREELDRQLDQRTVALALPGGDPPRVAWRGTMFDAGYTVIATSRWGVNHGGTRGGLRWIQRCTVVGAVAPHEFRRIAEGDPRLAWRRRVREGALRALRRSIGPSRYLRWRNSLFNAIGGNPHEP